MVDAPVDMKMPDAPPSYDLTCIGKPAPTATDPTIALSGVVTGVDVSGLPPMPEVTMLDKALVEVCNRGTNCAGMNRRSRKRRHA